MLFRFTEQLLGLTLAVLGVVSLITENVFWHPFRLPDENDREIPLILNIALSANIGKYIFITIHIIFIITRNPQFKKDMVHHVITIVCLSVFVVTKQNLLLSLCGLIMELSTLPVDVAKILKGLDVEKRSLLYQAFLAGGCLGNVVFRGLIPVLFLTIGAIYQSPFIMHYVPLIFFFLSLLFYSLVSVFLIYKTASKWTGCSLCFKEQTSNVVGTQFCHPTDARTFNIPPRNGRRYKITRDRQKPLKYTRNHIDYLRRTCNANIYNEINDTKNNIYNKKNIAKDDINFALGNEGSNVPQEHHHLPIVSLARIAGSGMLPIHPTERHQDTDVNVQTISLCLRLPDNVRTSCERLVPNQQQVTSEVS